MVGVGPLAGSRTIQQHSLGSKRQILLVEDEAFVRDVTAEVLQAAGYSVLMARNAAEALELHERALGPVNLLMSDVVLPDRSGRDLAGQLRAVDPEIRVLLVSGYAEHMSLSQSGDGHGYLAKPFSTQTLLDKVSELLDGASG